MGRCQYGEEGLRSSQEGLGRGAPSWCLGADVDSNAGNLLLAVVRGEEHTIDERVLIHAAAAEGERKRKCGLCNNAHLAMLRTTYSTLGVVGVMGGLCS